MIIRRRFKKKDYILSNEDLKNGDKVYPIADGQVVGDKFIVHEFHSLYNKYLHGFFNEPHTILNIEHSKYKPYQIMTDKGYGPIEQYYKIIL